MSGVWMLVSPYALCSCHRWRVYSLSPGRQMLEKSNQTDGIVYFIKSPLYLYMCNRRVKLFGYRHRFWSQLVMDLRPDSAAA